MLDISDIQTVIGNTFFGGNLQVAGIIILVLAIMVIFALTQDTLKSLVLSLPVLFAFSLLGILSTDVMILMIIVVVLAIAYMVRSTQG